MARKQRDNETAYTSRRRCRGTYYRDYVLAFVCCFAENVGCSFSFAVNSLLEKAMREGLSDLEEQLRLEVRRRQLLVEERSLRERLTVILRSGAYLKDYAKELLLGDFKQISFLKKRVGVYAHVKPKELNVILRILKRRKDLVNELLEIEDKLLPSEPYPFMVTEHGWKIGELHYARDNRPGSRTEPTGRPKTRPEVKNQNERK